MTSAAATESGKGTAANSLGPLSPTGSLLVSLMFWGSLGSAAVLYALLTLSPRLLEAEALRLRQARNQAELCSLAEETAHLTNVARALQSDPDFVARVAASELQALPSGGTHLPVSPSLGYDARVPQAGVSAPLPAPRWYTPALVHLARSGDVRTRCGAACVGLVAFAFFCCHDAFFAGGLGALLAGAGRGVVRRYTRSRPTSA